MVIDLRMMQFCQVNKHDDRARFGAGVTFDQVNTVLGAFDRHIPGGACNSVRIGGFMQGGGYGFTSRIFGMNIDSVRSFRMMLADGRIVVASRDQNYDLFWAARGGTGNNFGVLLDVEYTLHPLGDLRGFGLSWDLDDPSDLKKVPSALLTLQTDYMMGQPGSFGYMLAFRKMAGKTSLLMRGVYHGPTAEAQAWLDRLLVATGGHLEFKQLEKYKRLETIMMQQYQIDPDDVDGAKEDKQSGYIDRMLSLEEWEKIVHRIRSAGPILNFVVIEPYGGRIAEIPASDSAFVHRSVHMDFYVDVWWVADAEKAAAVQWLDDFMTFMQPLFNGMTYQNYPRTTFEDYPLNYWGIDTYTELVAIKRKYDPGNFFTFPQAIGCWKKFQPSNGIGDPKLTAAIHDPVIVV
jgi:FAD/FMN-containing dehydrogenase